METAISNSTYITFELAEETFSVNVSKVLEIVEVPRITKVPQSPDYLCGVINLRGTVLPVVDTKIKFGMGTTKRTIDTNIVVLEVLMDDGEKIHVGALVDKVMDVIDIDVNEIKESPTLGGKYNPDFLLGMGKVGEDFAMILNIDRVFSVEEMTLLKDSSD